MRKPGATVIGATLQTTQTRRLCIRRFHLRNRNPPRQTGERPPTLSESGTEKRGYPYTTRADRNGIRSYPQKAGSYKTATESSLIGRKRGITPPRKYGSRHSAGNGRLEMARLNLSYTVVTAPCDGKLGRRALEEASSLQPGKPSPTFCPTLKNGLSPTTKRHKWRTCV